MSDVYSQENQQTISRSFHKIIRIFPKPSNTLDFVIFEKDVDSVISDGFINDIILIFFGSGFGSEGKRDKVTASLELNVVEGGMESLEENIESDLGVRFYHCNFFFYFIYNKFQVRNLLT